MNDRYPPQLVAYVGDGISLVRAHHNGDEAGFVRLVDGLSPMEREVILYALAGITLGLLKDISTLTGKPTDGLFNQMIENLHGGQP